MGYGISPYVTWLDALATEDLRHLDRWDIMKRVAELSYMMPRPSMATFDLASLPLDRRLPGQALASFDPGRLEIECVPEGAPEVLLQMKPMPETLCVSPRGLTMTVSILWSENGSIYDMAQKDAVLLPRRCYCEPERALRELELNLQALPDRLGALTAGWSREESFEFLGLDGSWEPGTPKCREWTEADRTIVAWDVDGLLALGTTPVLDIANLYGERAHPPYDPPDVLTGRDVYRITDDTLRIVEARGTTDGLERLLPQATLLVTRELQTALAYLEVPAVVVWEPDPGEPGAFAAEILAHGAVSPTTEWASDIETARTLVLRKHAPGAPAVPVARWLVDGLAAGRWSEPAMQPPILAEVQGRVAVAALARGVTSSVITKEEAERAIAALVSRGAYLDPDGPAELNCAGLTIRGPRDEAHAAGLAL
ncbi:MAG: hypothetical protein AB8I08_21570 [Sandaracinaceae bacterium]